MTRDNERSAGVMPSLCACTAFKLASLIETPGGAFLAASAYALASMVKRDVPLAE